MPKETFNYNIIQFDFIKGALHSLEHTSRSEQVKFNYYLETAPIISNPGHWITAVYKNGKYIIIQECRGSRRAKMIHVEWYRKIKFNDYKLDGLIDEFKKQRDELPERIYQSGLLTTMS